VGGPWFDNAEWAYHVGPTMGGLPQGPLLNRSFDASKVTAEERGRKHRVPPALAQPERGIPKLQAVVARDLGLTPRAKRSEQCLGARGRGAPMSCKALLIGTIVGPPSLSQDLSWLDRTATPGPRFADTIISKTAFFWKRGL
jgi:hypothetical protein